jgi:hypothetical protein
MQLKKMKNYKISFCAVNKLFVETFTVIILHNKTQDKFLEKSFTNYEMDNNAISYLEKRQKTQ